MIVVEGAMNGVFTSKEVGYRCLMVHNILTDNMYVDSVTRWVQPVIENKSGTSIDYVKHMTM